MSEARKKSGLLKKLLLGVAVLAVFLVGTLITVPFLIDWNKVRKMAEEKGSEILGRELRIKSLKVSLLSGVVVTGFRIGPAPKTSQEPLVQADRMTAKYRLLPLLRFKIVIHRIELDRPRLYVDRGRNGVFSFADLMQAAPRKADSREMTKPMALPVDVAVSVIKITGGSLRFRDQSAKPVMTVELDGFDLLVNGFNLNGADTRIKANATARLNGNPLAVGVDGRFGINLNRSLLTFKDLAVKVPGIKAVTNGLVKEFQVLPTMAISETVAVDLPAVWEGFKPFMESAMRSRFTPAGSLVSRVEIAGTIKKLAITGGVTFNGVSVKMADMPGICEGLEGDLNFDSDRISSSNIRFKTMGNPVILKCDIGNLGLANPEAFNLKRFSPRGKFVLDSSRITIPEAFLPPLEGTKGAGGTVAGDRAAGGKGSKAAKSPEMDLRGMIPSGVDLDGEIRIGKLTARKFSVSDVNGTVRIVGGAVSFKQSCVVYGGKESMTGKVLPSRFPFEYAISLKADGVALKELVDDSMESFVAGKNEYKGLIAGTGGADIKLEGKGAAFPGIQGRFVADLPQITVPEAFLPPLEESKVASGTVAGAKGGKAPEPSEMDLRGMIPSGIDLDGDVRIGRLTARKFTVSDIASTVRISGGSVSFKQSCGLYGGKESGTGQVLPSRFPLEYAISLKADGVALKELMDDSIESFVMKKNGFKGRISGATGADIKLEGKGHTLPNLKKQLKGSGTFRLDDGKVSKFDFFEKGIGKILKLDFLAKDIGFRSAGGSFTIAEGRFDTPDFVMDPGPEGDLGFSYRGWVDFDFNLKGSMTTRIHPRHADAVMQGDVGSALFSRENGWAVGDWDVRGSLTMPILTPSRKQMTNKAKEVVKDTVQEKVKDRIPELKDAGKKALQNLFKKKK